MPYGYARRKRDYSLASVVAPGIESFTTKNIIGASLRFFLLTSCFSIAKGLLLPSLGITSANVY